MQLQSLETALKKVATALQQADGGELFTDIHLQPVGETGELMVYNDDEDLLLSAPVKEWKQLDEETLYAKAETGLRKVLKTLYEDGVFANLSILKPYSFVLVDANKETVTDLLLVDEDTLLVDEELLKGLDEELNEFLSKLLEE